MSLAIHEQVDIVLGLQGKTEFHTQEIRDLCWEKYRTNRTSVIPSDYCYNRTNEGITNEHRFLLYLQRGLYRYVGKDYPYNGPVYAKRRGEKEDIVVGNCRKGVFSPIAHQPM